MTEVNYSILTQGWVQHGYAFDRSFKHPLDASDPDSFLLDHVPVNIHVAYHQFLARHVDTVVSVGSGCGVVESLLRQFWPPTSYLVEPADQLKGRAWDGKFVLRPDFPLLKDLIQAHPEVVGNCGLLIMYPSPWDSYDAEAIRTLKPKIIVMSWEIGGTSGSEEFLEWAREQMDYREISHYDSIDFYARFRYLDRRVFPQLSLYVRKDVEILGALPPSGVHYVEADYEQAKTFSIEDRKAHFGSQVW